MSNGHSKTIPATSGIEGVTDPSIVNKGPIPPGDYELDPAEISQTSWKRKLDPRDWGEYRVPLKPLEGTDLQGRSDFMLHGGVKPGSAGCIDIGRADHWVFPLLQRQSGRILVRVIYGEE